MKLDVKFSESNQSFVPKLGGSDKTFGAKYSGVQTIHGRDGVDGKSAYEIAVANGFEGTEEAWLGSLHGKDGVDGRNGIDGKDGYTPVKGVDYCDGIDGRNGIDGKDGYAPIKGVDYRDGIDGKDGVNGKDGYTPVKGTDYFTEAEKVEMINAVKAQLITEQWTFTLVDGSVVAKDVVME